MIKQAVGILLLVALVLSAGCIIEVTEKESIIPSTNPTEQPASESIIGDWEGYDVKTKTSYDLQCSAKGYAELETDDESVFPDIEVTKRGTWEGSKNAFTLILSGEKYTFTLSENPWVGELTTPEGKKVTMYRDY